MRILSVGLVRASCDHEKCGPNRPTAESSCNNAVPTRFLHDCRRTAARNPPAPDIRRHATLPQSWIQRENWEFETHTGRAPTPYRRIRGAQDVRPQVGATYRG